VFQKVENFSYVSHIVKLKECTFMLSTQTHTNTHKHARTHARKHARTHARTHTHQISVYSYNQYLWNGIRMVNRFFFI